MKLIVLTALVAVCGAAKLDRSYLPPESAKTAGGNDADLATPSFRGSPNNQGLKVPKGGYANEHQGIIVDAAAAGTRAAGPGDSGLGAPRATYGSEASKVGDAAFRQAPGPPQNFPSFSQGAQSPQNNYNQGPHQLPNGYDQNTYQQEFLPNNNGPQDESNERPQAAQDRTANIVRYDSEVGPESFNFAFETDNGIIAEENGVASNGVQAQGGFSYKSDDGQVYSVSYVADENGYQPQGAHLPTPPPIPEEILRSLEKNAQDEANGVTDDGSYDAKKYNGGDYTDNANRRYNNGPSNNEPENGVDIGASGSNSNENVQPFSRTQSQPNANANYQSYLPSNAYQGEGSRPSYQPSSQTPQNYQGQPQQLQSQNQPQPSPIPQQQGNQNQFASASASYNRGSNHFQSGYLPPRSNPQNIPSRNPVSQPSPSTYQALQQQEPAQKPTLIQQLPLENDQINLENDDSAHDNSLSSSSYQQQKPIRIPQTYVPSRSSGFGAAQGNVNTRTQQSLSNYQPSTLQPQPPTLAPSSSVPDSQSAQEPSHENPKPEGDEHSDSIDANKQEGPTDVAPDYIQKLHGHSHESSSYQFSEAGSQNNYYGPSTFGAQNQQSHDLNSYGKPQQSYQNQPQIPYSEAGPTVAAEPSPSPSNGFSASTRYPKPPTFAPSTPTAAAVPQSHSTGHAEVSAESSVSSTPASLYLQPSGQSPHPQQTDAIAKPFTQPAFSQSQNTPQPPQFGQRINQQPQPYRPRTPASQQAYLPPRYQSQPHQPQRFGQPQVPQQQAPQPTPQQPSFYQQPTQSSYQLYQPPSQSPQQYSGQKSQPQPSQFQVRQQAPTPIPQQQLSQELPQVSSQPQPSLPQQQNPYQQTPYQPQQPTQSSYNQPQQQNSYQNNQPQQPSGNLQNNLQPYPEQPQSSYQAPQQYEQPQNIYQPQQPQRLPLNPAESQNYQRNEQSPPQNLQGGSNAASSQTVPPQQHDEDLYNYNRPPEVLSANDANAEGSAPEPTHATSQNEKDQPEILKTSGKPSEEGTQPQSQSAGVEQPSFVQRYQSPVSGAGEVFDLQRPKPSYDDETGYHY